MDIKAFWPTSLSGSAMSSPAGDCWRRVYTVLAVLYEYESVPAYILDMS